MALCRVEGQYRVHHGPVQGVGEELGPGCGDLLDQALNVLPLLLRVDAALCTGDLSAVQAEALVVVAIVQRHQLPLAWLLVGLFVVKLVEDALHSAQLLPLVAAELTGTASGAWRGLGKVVSKYLSFVLV